MFTYEQQQIVADFERMIKDPSVGTKSWRAGKQPPRSKSGLHLFENRLAIGDTLPRFRDAMRYAKNTGAHIRICDWDKPPQFEFSYGLNVAEVDQITMPHPAQTRDPVTFATGLLHELVHWAAAPPRMDVSKARPRTIYEMLFGAEGRGAEEMAAEIGSVFLSSRYGFADMAASGPYVKGWLADYDGDMNRFHEAAKDAAERVAYLDSLQ